MFEGFNPSSFLLGFGIIVSGYLAQNSFLQYIYYYLRHKDVKQWKIQPHYRAANIVPTFYAPPLLSTKPNQAPYHNLIGTINLVVAGCFGGYLSQLSYSAFCPFSFDPIVKYGLVSVLLELFLAVMWQCIVEYYWHRTMHLKWFYTRFHKFHHAYKSPEVWDDMYIHPVEAFGYYCILYAPPYLFQLCQGQMHIASFVLYMVIMGVCGVLDHSGVSLTLRLWLPTRPLQGKDRRRKGASNQSWWPVVTLYDTRDHDLHHKLFNVNYSFPFPFMDMLHGTYHREKLV